ncbi:MAG TPA: hypothetical protein VFM24_09035 [Nitrospira sp.]|nr:hypothetical protein [Nitrospira sp.]
MRKLFTCGWLLLSAVLAAASFNFQWVTAASAETPEVTFLASDHRFDGPDSVPAGQTTVRLRNRGKEPHQLQFLKLEQGKTPADLDAALKSDVGSIPPWAKHVGGPNGVGGGETSEATLYLEAGSYVMICGIPGKQHKTHAALGMQKPLRVTETHAPPPEFQGNFHMAMLDYEFVVVQPLRKGRHTFYVVNRGNQIHQASFIRLHAGASAEDVLAALDRDDPSRLPGALIGGMSGLEPGRDGTFTADLTPGRYAIMCLFSSGKTTESHAAKGMVMNFTIE